MDGSRPTIGLLVAATLLWSGCASPFHSAQPAADPSAPSLAKAPSQLPEGAAASGAPSTIPPAPSQPGPQPASGAPSPAPSGAAGPDSRDFSNIIAELQTLGALDPAARDRLMEDLKRTDPALWPQMMQYYRAALAYQRRAAGQPPDPSRPPTAAQVPARADDTAASRAPTETLLAGRGVAEPPVTDQGSIASAIASPAAASAPAGASKPAGTEPAAPSTSPSSVPAGMAADRVVPASYDRPVVGDDWQARLNAAILALEAETAQPPKTAAETARHVQLRFLYLAAGRRDDAMRPIQGLPAAEQDFWSKELYGLAGYLDLQRVPDAAQRATQAMQPLAEARARLGELSSLAVRNLAFCTEVVSYGVYTRFEKNEFKPGQEVLLYAELDHFKSEQTSKGFHTALKSSYQILDSRGQRVAEQEFPPTEEYCQNPRRDFFIRYFLFMPKRIYDGKYTLQLTIEDLKSRKVGQSSVEFTIREK